MARSTRVAEGRRPAAGCSGPAPIPGWRRHARRSGDADRLQRDGLQGGRIAVDEDFALQRSGAGLAVRPEPSCADLSGIDDHAPLSVQRVLRDRTGAERGRLRLSTARGRARAPTGVLDSRAAGVAAAAGADYAHHLRLALEAERKIARRPVD